MSGSDAALIVTAVGGWLTTAATLLQARWAHRDQRDAATALVTKERDTALATVEQLEAAVTAKASEAEYERQKNVRLEAENDSLRDRISELERMLYARGAAS